nr:ORF1 [Bracoviriform inaniti]
MEKKFLLFHKEEDLCISGPQFFIITADTEKTKDHRATIQHHNSTLAHPSSDKDDGGCRSKRMHKNDGLLEAKKEPENQQA